MIIGEIAWLQGVSANVSNSTNIYPSCKIQCVTAEYRSSRMLWTLKVTLSHCSSDGFDLNANRGFSIWILN
jgi:hypothetical protein